jgi:NAD+ kinase
LNNGNGLNKGFGVTNTIQKIHFVASDTDAAREALETMTARYGQSEPENAEVVVTLGGDGFMLRTLHRLLPANLPVYGMKIGNVGFLMNRFRKDKLRHRLAAANRVELKPLSMIALTEAGNEVRALAINEVALLRQMNQAAHVRILVNDSAKVEELVCDGVLAISPFRPRSWRGAVLPASVRIRFEILNCYKRPVIATADAHEVRNVVSVDVFEEKDVTLKLLFDPDHSLEERILDEQFL